MTERTENFIPANQPHRHDLPSRANTGDLARCTLCGRWFYALPHSVWRGPNTHWAPVSWWNRKHKRRIASSITLEVGRCGAEAPQLIGVLPAFCRLPHGHAGWHRGDDGNEWNVPADVEERQ